uniref:Uncharacterized protein n=1 Tax=Moniliophthora roreri TaxID=221103 RepID=A0A0W0F7N9_MONRR
MWEGMPVEELENYLLPSWRPKHIPLPTPPPLPVFSGPVFIPSAHISLPPRRLRSITPPISQIPDSSLPRRGSLMLKNTSSLDSVGSKNSDDIELDDLEQFDKKRDEVQEWIVWRCPNELQVDVGDVSSLKRNIDMLYIPPTSIHYDVFRKKVREMEKSGLIDPKGQSGRT